MASMKMKVMKAAMKMKKAMKVSKIAKGKFSKVSVFKGYKVKTVGGLTKDKLFKSKSGKIVSKKSSAAGKKAYKYIAKWNKAVIAAKKTLGYKGFIPVGGKSVKGAALLKKAKSLY